MCLSYTLSLNMIREVRNNVLFSLVVDQVVTISVLIVRNAPKIIEALSVDGSSGQQIESSKRDPLSGAV